MSPYSLNTVDHAPEIEAQDLDTLTLDKQVVKDLEPANDEQVRAGGRSILSTATQSATQ